MGPHRYRCEALRCIGAGSPELPLWALRGAGEGPHSCRCWPSETLQCGVVTVRCGTLRAAGSNPLQADRGSQRPTRGSQEVCGAFGSPVESLETSKIHSNASGVLRVVGVGPSKVTGEWPSDAQVPSEAVRGSGVEPPEPPIRSTGFGTSFKGAGRTQRWQCGALS